MIWSIHATSLSDVEITCSRNNI